MSGQILNYYLILRKWPPYQSLLLCFYYKLQFEGLFRLRDKMAGVEGLKLTPSHKHHNYNYLINNHQQNHLKDTQKDTLHPKTEKKPHQDGRRGAFTIWAILYLPGGKPTDGKITISKRLTNRVKTSKPHIKFPAWRSGIGRISPKSIWHWRPVGLEWRSTTRLVATHKCSCTLGLRAKKGLNKNLGKNYEWILTVSWEEGVSFIPLLGKNNGCGGPME